MSLSTFNTFNSLINSNKIIPSGPIIPHFSLKYIDVTSRLNRNGFNLLDSNTFSNISCICMSSNGRIVVLQGYGSSIFYAIISYDYGISFYTIMVIVNGVNPHVNGYTLSYDDKYLYAYGTTHVCHTSIIGDPKTQAGITWYSDITNYTGLSTFQRGFYLTNNSIPTVFLCNSDNSIIHYATLYDSSISSNASSNPTFTNIPVDSGNTMSTNIYNFSINSDGSIVVCGLGNMGSIYISYNKTAFIKYDFESYPYWSLPRISDTINGYATIMIAISPTGVGSHTWKGNVNVVSQTIVFSNITANIVQSTSSSYFIFPMLSTSGNILITGNNTAVSYSLDTGTTWSIQNYPTSLTSTLNGIISSDGSAFIISYGALLMYGTTGVLG